MTMVSSNRGCAAREREAAWAEEDAAKVMEGCHQADRVN